MASQTLESAPSATVSQSEIESLLAAASAIDAPDIIGASPGEAHQPSSGVIQRHDFPKLFSFKATELRKLRVRHEEYIRALGGRLSSHLNIECKVRMSKLEGVGFAEFVNALSSPTHLTLMKFEPLEGICLIDTPPRLGLSIVDRELGGPGKSDDAVRELSKMESKLLWRVIEIIATEWCGTWSDIYDLRPVQLRTESNASFLKIHQPGTMLLSMGVEIAMGEVVEQFQFGLPHFTLEPLVQKLDAELQHPERHANGKPLPATKWSGFYDEVKVDVRAFLPDIEVTAGEAANLKVGDVIPITPEMLSQIQLQLANSTKFVGSLGLSGEKWAVKINQAVSNQSS